VYVPAVVSVTGEVLCPALTFTETGGSVAPAGPDWKSTLWTAVVSLLVQTMVLFTPITTVMVAGEKFSDMLLPTPAGMYTVVVVGADVADDEDEVVRLDVVVVLLVVDVVMLVVGMDDVVVVDRDVVDDVAVEPGAKMK